MSSFDHILNWELKAGSHKFPGPNGGTCINEAAIVAAGFEYRKVASYEDCPPCFCPVLSAVAIGVNDCMGSRERQALMPLVTRLAGSKGEPWEEMARIQFIIQSAMDAFGQEALKDLDRRGLSRSQGGLDLDRARQKLREAWRLAPFEPPRAAEAFVVGMASLAHALRAGGAVRWMVKVPMPLEMPTISSLEEDLTVRMDMVHADDVWPRIAVILTRAFEIGTRAPPLDTAQIVERMETAKRTAKRQKVDA